MPVKKKRKASAAKSTAKKKTTVRKTAAKKATSTKKAATTAKKMKTTAVRSAYNKSQLLNELADTTELSRKQVAEVFEALGNTIQRHLKKGGVGEFTIPGISKFKVTRKPATKARKGINPFTGEMITFKAKPARNVVKIRPLKKLKEMVE